VGPLGQRVSRANMMQSGRQTLGRPQQAARNKEKRKRGPLAPVLKRNNARTLVRASAPIRPSAVPANASLKAPEIRGESLVRLYAGYLQSNPVPVGSPDKGEPSLPKPHPDSVPAKSAGVNQIDQTKHRDGCGEARKAGIYSRPPH
jgi:hypothetical protein